MELGILWRKMIEMQLAGGRLWVETFHEIGGRWPEERVKGLMFVIFGGKVKMDLRGEKEARGMMSGRAE